MRIRFVSKAYQPSNKRLPCLVYTQHTHTHTSTFPLVCLPFATLHQEIKIYKIISVCLLMKIIPHENNGEYTQPAAMCLRQCWAVGVCVWLLLFLFAFSISALHFSLSIEQRVSRVADIRMKSLAFIQMQ